MALDPGTDSALVDPSPCCSQLRGNTETRDSNKRERTAKMKRHESESRHEQVRTTGRRTEGKRRRDGREEHDDDAYCLVLAQLLSSFLLDLKHLGHQMWSR